MANISQIRLPNNETYDIDSVMVNGHSVAKNVPSDAVFTDTTYTPGENINISVENVISADQAEPMTYDEYDDLTPAERMQNKIRFLTEGVPYLANLWFDSTTNTIVFAEGFASYDDETKTIKIGG